ncbi:hypothetical protein OH77DRAFT_1592508, partial [Trametes cingulata]
MKRVSSATAWRHKRWARLREALGDNIQDAGAPERSKPATQDLPPHLPPGDNGLPGTSSRSDSRSDSTAEALPPSAPSSRPSPPPATIASQLDDLLHVQLAFIQGMVAFTVSGRSLRFMKPPSGDESYERWHVRCAEPCNSGKCSLDPNDGHNLPFLEHQEWLSVSYRFLKAMETESHELVLYRDGLMRQMEEELERLEDMKEWEWEEQRKHGSPGSTSHSSRFTINTDRHVASQWTTWTSTSTPVYAYSIVSATSNLLLGLSRKATSILMGGLRSTIQITLEYARAPGPLLPQDEQLLRRL